MVLSFLIATLILFSLNVILNLISLGSALVNSSGDRALTIGISVFIYLSLLTWNIFALNSL